jgi:dTDP-4-amino-4,6-dideoxygalactose transaminase
MTGLTIPFVGLVKQYNNLRTEILDATDEVLRSGQLMDGNFTAEFENWLARRNSVKYAVTCHSGTQALEIIAAYYATERGAPNPPTVLIPAVTYVATANAFMRAGWAVHFIDVDSYGVFDMRSIPDVSYQAMVLVGLYGAAITHIGDTKIWRQTVLRDGLVIEDAAQHWLAADGIRIGQAAAISFDPMKNLAAYGNGGAVVTNDADLYRYAQAWRNNGKPDHHHAGTNSRMSETDCAQLLVKTRYIDEWQQRRAKIAQFWMDKLQSAAVRCLINRDNWHDHSYHKFVIDVEARDILQKNLAIRGIETRVHYAQPLHEIDIYRQWPGPTFLSSASALCRRVLSLPIYPELTDLQVEYITDQVRDCVTSSG